MENKKETGTNNNELLFQLEVLRARLEIRDFFLKTTVKEIYENVGQVLSLIRIQLGGLYASQKDFAVDELVNSGDLVGQSIRDLRTMSRSFYPDEDILKDGGLQSAINDASSILGFEYIIQPVDRNQESNMEPGIKLIAFKFILNVLHSIAEAKGHIKKMSMVAKDQQFLFSISFTGTLIKNELCKAENGLLKNDLATLVNANYTMKNNKGVNKILFKVPKLFLYE